MTYDDMVHAIRAAADVAGVTDLFVFGSQAILLRLPNAPEELRQSVELDMAVLAHPDLTDQIDGALGEESQFHRTHGYYVHGVDLEAARLPQGWNERVITQTFENGRVRVTSPEIHDLAASKLAAGRDKDFSYVAVLIRDDVIEPRKLLQRINKLPIPKEQRERLRAWIGKIADQLSG
jgi:hypothetical protein